MHNSIEARLQAALAQRSAEGNLRELKLETGIDFYSNDYLGYARSEELKRQISAEFDRFPAEPTGSTGSRLLAGNSAYAMSLEAELAGFFDYPASLIFNSGFDANLALLSTLATRTDTIVYDELVHASIHAGIRLSNARTYKFRHNDPESLREKIKLGTGTVFVAVESLYSMDGDLAPLSDFARICREEGACLIVDEAHSTGIMGPDGRGLVAALGLETEVLAVLHTFGKGMGTHGACISGSGNLKSFLVNFARPFIYSTSLPFHTLVTMRMSLHFGAADLTSRTRLQEHIRLFRELSCLPPAIMPAASAIAPESEPLADDHSEDALSGDAPLAGALSGHVLSVPKILASGPIQTLVIPGNEACKRASRELISAGFIVRAILAPTVAPGTERLRICLHAFNSPDEITRLAALLNDMLIR